MTIPLKFCKNIVSGFQGGYVEVKIMKMGRMADGTLCVMGDETNQSQQLLIRIAQW